MTDDYTPDTAEIRAAWFDSFRVDSEGGRCIENGEIHERWAEFDRWLRKVKAEAWDEGSYARAENMAREIWEDGDILLNPYED